jgi:hypothetical protein
LHSRDQRDGAHCNRSFTDANPLTFNSCFDDAVILEWFPGRSIATASGQRRLQAKLGQLLGGVRREIDADPSGLISGAVMAAS